MFLLFFASSLTQSAIFVNVTLLAVVITKRLHNPRE